MWRRSTAERRKSDRENGAAAVPLIDKITAMPAHDVLLYECVNLGIGRLRIASSGLFGGEGKFELGRDVVATQLGLLGVFSERVPKSARQVTLSR
jgi:hypothetical protein